MTVTMSSDQSAFWSRFLATTARPAETPCFEVFAFGLTESHAEELLALVLDGPKRATASSGLVYGPDDRPLVGSLALVTDATGRPRCVIETTTVTVLPFDEVTEEMALREGEDDSLASWQEGHGRYFTAEGEELGYEFTQTMPVIFENFEVVYRED